MVELLMYMDAFETGSVPDSLSTRPLMINCAWEINVKKRKKESKNILPCIQQR
jgi:hypothetical protein